MDLDDDLYIRQATTVLKFRAGEEWDAVVEEYQKR